MDQPPKRFVFGTRSRMRLRGTIRGVPSGMNVDWQTPSGATVGVRGSELEAECQWDHSRPHGGQDDVRQEVESWLLVETLEARAPIAIEWTSYSEIDEHGNEVGLYSPTISLSFRPRVAVGEPDRVASKACVVAGRAALSSALIQVRLAMEVWSGDARDSMGRLYAAAETLVLDYCGSTSRRDWESLGAEIGFGGPAALQLYDLLQFGRHVRTDIAEHQLATAGLPRLPPGDCLDAVRRLIEAVLAHGRASLPPPADD